MELDNGSIDHVIYLNINEGNVFNFEQFDHKIFTGEIDKKAKFSCIQYLEEDDLNIVLIE